MLGEAGRTGLTQINMSNSFSRREFFAILGRPVTRARQRVQAGEQRLRQIKAIQQVEIGFTRECARCYAPFVSGNNALLCPACLEIEEKQKALLADLPKPNP